jgi:hypothetical protein
LSQKNKKQEREGERERGRRKGGRFTEKNSILAL